MIEVPVKDVDKLIKFLNDNDFESNFKEMELGYQSSVLICMDAVLSIQRKYYSFVVPRIVNFQNEHGDINTLEKLCNFIDSIGVKGFCNCWNYNHEYRVRMLYDLAKYFSDLVKSKKQDEFVVMKEWADTVNVEEHKKFPVKGIGLATFQYIRKLLGSSTVKPDVHIKRAISNALGKDVDDLYAIKIIEEVGKKLNKNAIDIDYFIWSMNVTGGDNPPYVWKNDFWEKVN